MNQTELNTRHRAVLGRWWVTMRDTGGRPPQQMLDELAKLADEYARQPCCDLHGRNCEVPSELCCDRCTEARHLAWTDERGVSRNGHPAGEICSNPDLSGTSITPPATPSPPRRQPARTPKVIPVKTRGTK